MRSIHCVLCSTLIISYISKPPKHNCLGVLFPKSLYSLMHSMPESPAPNFHTAIIPHIYVFVCPQLSTLFLWQIIKEHPFLLHHYVQSLQKCQNYGVSKSVAHQATILQQLLAQSLPQSVILWGIHGSQITILLLAYLCCNNIVPFVSFARLTYFTDYIFNNLL